jgi:hypothetical protein
MIRSLLLSAVLFLLLTSNPPAFGAEPAANEIPVIGQRLTSWMWSPQLLCELAWKYFDGFEFEGYTFFATHEMMLTADSIGLLVIITPSEFYEISRLGEHSRAHFGPLGSNSAFFQTDELGDQVDSTFTSHEMQDELVGLVDMVTDTFSNYDALWS